MVLWQRTWDDSLHRACLCHVASVWIGSLLTCSAVSILESPFTNIPSLLSCVEYPVFHIPCLLFWFISLFGVKGWWDHHSLSIVSNRAQSPWTKQPVNLPCSCFWAVWSWGIGRFTRGRRGLTSSVDAWLLGWHCCWLVGAQGVFIEMNWSLIGWLVKEFLLRQVVRINWVDLKLVLLATFY